MLFNLLKILSCLFFVFLSLPTLAAPVEVFVSILPQQYFVQRIGGDYVNVNVMVKPGQSPETFEPSPKLMSVYSRADVYFTIDMPFEQVWIDRVASLNPRISIKSVQPDKGSLLHANHEHGDSLERGGSLERGVRMHPEWDPHTWLSPVIAASQAQVIMAELSRLQPENKSVFLNNYNKIEEELKVLDKNISNQFKNTDPHHFVTFHPAFSYFAQQYQLTQVSIEMDGKEPSAKQIARIVDRIKDKKVPYILIERQFNQVIPKTIARSVNAELLVVDPLSYDYINNMQDIADKISRALF